MKVIASILIIAVGFFFNINEEKTTGTTIIKRETVQTIAYAKGIVHQVGNQDVYMIECPEKHLKLNVVNLPEEYKEQDLPVTFSGNIKLTMPLEDENGDFFEVKTIH